MPTSDRIVVNILIVVQSIVTQPTTLSGLDSGRSRVIIGLRLVDKWGGHHYLGS